MQAILVKLRSLEGITRPLVHIRLLLAGTGMLVAKSRVCSLHLSFMIRVLCMLPTGQLVHFIEGKRALRNNSISTKQKPQTVFELT